MTKCPHGKGDGFYCSECYVLQLCELRDNLQSERDGLKAINATLSEALRVAREEAEEARERWRVCTRDLSDAYDEAHALRKRLDVANAVVVAAEAVEKRLEARAREAERDRQAVEEEHALGMCELKRVQARAALAEVRLAEARSEGVKLGFKAAAAILRDSPNCTMLPESDPVEWAAKILDARAIDGSLGNWLAAPVPTRAAEPVPGPTDAPCTCSWAGVGRETCRSPHHVEKTGGKPAPGDAPAGSLFCSACRLCPRHADELERAPEPRQAGEAPVVTRDGRNGLRFQVFAAMHDGKLNASQRGDEVLRLFDEWLVARQAGEVTREAPRAPFFPACCDLSRCGHREGCPGKAAEAPPLVAAPEVATLAHGQSKRPVAPPTPGPARPSWCWGQMWCDGDPCTCRDGAPLDVVDQARQQDADAEPGFARGDVTFFDKAVAAGVAWIEPADVPAKACETWCGADLMTPPAPSVLAWSNDDGWWCSVACKRAGRPLRPSTATAAKETP